MTDSDSSSSANDSREDDMIRHNDEGHDKPARPLRMPKAIVFDLGGLVLVWVFGYWRQLIDASHLFGY
jgi:hypothetical protein